MMGIKNQHSQVAVVAREVLEGETPLFEGIRKICSLRLNVEDPENEIFFPILAVESDTDHYPLGPVRSQYSQDYLRRLDAEMEDYMEEAKEEVFKACREIIRAYS